MTDQAQKSDWRMVRRMALGTPVWNSRLDTVMLAAALGFYGLTAAPVLAPLKAGKALTFHPLISAQLIAFAVFGAYGMVGALNGGWRMLPVTLRERSAAVWLLLVAFPVAMSGVLAVMAAGLATALGWIAPSAFPERALALFAVHALICEVLALAIVLIGDWPTELGWMFKAGIKNWRAMLLSLMFAATMLGGIFLGGKALAIAGFAVPGALVALALGAALLPITVRFARLDKRADQESLLGLLEEWLRLSGLRLGGWRGHILIEVGRTLAMGTLFVAIFWLIGRMIALQVGGVQSDFSKGLRTGASLGTTLVPWLQPGMIAALMSGVSLQYTMRQRRMVLTLPGGGRLIAVTHLAVFATVFAIALPFALPAISALSKGWLLLGVGTLLMLGFSLVWLAVLLRVVSYADILKSSLLFLLPTVTVGIFAVDTLHHMQWAENFWVVLAAVGFALIGAGSWWITCLLWRSRRPYRAWPLMTSRWRGA